MASGYGYVGSWDIDALMTFTVQTVDNQGTLSDASSGPDYRIYEDEDATPLLTGTMALLDAVNTVGFYSEQILISLANGFVPGRSYEIYIEYMDGPRLFGELRQFQIGLAADIEFVETSQLGARQLRLSTDQLLQGTVDDSTLAPSQTSFETNANKVTTDFFKDRDVYWTSGILEGSKTTCVGYSFTNGKGRFQVSPMVLIPNDGDTFILV